MFKEDEMGEETAGEALRQLKEKIGDSYRELSNKECELLDEALTPELIIKQIEEERNG